MEKGIFCKCTDFLSVTFIDPLDRHGGDQTPPRETT